MDSSIDKTTDLGSLYLDNWNSLCRFAASRVGSVDDATDIVQETYSRLAAGDIDLSKISNIKSYLYRCIYNRCCDLLRLRSRRTNVSLDNVRIAIEEEFDMELREEVARVHELLSTIPVAQAEVVRMKINDCLTFAEISDILSIPLTTVKSRYKYGIIKLAEQYKRQTP